MLVYHLHSFFGEMLSIFIFVLGQNEEGVEPWQHLGSQGGGTCRDKCDPTQGLTERQSWNPVWTHFLNLTLRYRTLGMTRGCSWGWRCFFAQ